MMNKWLQIRHELGLHGIAGVALIVVGLIFTSSVLSPVEERAAQVREQVESENQRSDLSALDGTGSPSAMLAKFYDFFETDREITDYLARIYNLGQANGLQLRRGDYKAVRAKGERITQYQITLPLSGGYNQIRSFAAEVMDAIPILSMDLIRFERKQSYDSTVDAEITFTLYVEKS